MVESVFFGCGDWFFAPVAVITLISPMERLRLCKREEGREGGSGVIH